MRSPRSISLRTEDASHFCVLARTMASLNLVPKDSKTLSLTHTYHRLSFFFNYVDIEGRCWLHSAFQSNPLTFVLPVDELMYFLRLFELIKHRVSTSDIENYTYRIGNKLFPP